MHKTFHTLKDIFFQYFKLLSVRVVMPASLGITYREFLLKNRSRYTPFVATGSDTKKSIFTIIFLTFLFFSKTSSAQVFYSTDSKYILQKTEQNNITSTFKAAYPDSTISELSNFFTRNFMGNIGLPSPRYIFDYGTSNIGFKLFNNPQTHNLFSEQNVAYLKTSGPFASLTGIAGSKQLQIFKFQFTTTFKNKLNINIKFNRYGSTGFYLRQQTFINNFYTSSNYTSKNKRIGFYAYLLNNGTKNQENGGLKQDSLTAFDIKQNKALYATKISAAIQTNKEYKLQFNPWVRLNKSTDSVTGFSHYLQLKSKFNFNTYKYKDDNIRSDNYYLLFYLDTLKTYDSTRVLQAINDVNYTVLKNNSNFAASIGYRNELNNVWQKADSLFYNNFITTDFVFRKNLNANDSVNNSQIESTINAAYIYNGANMGNYKVESKSTITINKKNNLFFNVLFEKRNPDYIYNYWVSNHFRWFNNGFKPQEVLQAKLGYQFKKKFSISALYENSYNYLVIDNIGYPRQYNNTLQTVSINAAYGLTLFKHLGFNFNSIFQSTSNSSYINIPKYINTAKLFYTGNLFKNNLQLQIGGQCQSYSSFYGAGFMPATQLFYIQDRVKTGQYFYTDIFLHARIKPVQFFIKVENVLQGLVGRSYALVPGYYQPDRALRFGLTWLFFD